MMRRKHSAYEIVIATYGGVIADLIRNPLWEN